MTRSTSFNQKIEYLLKVMDFFSFAKNMAKNVGKSIYKNWSNKCSQNLLDHAKQKAAEEAGDLTGNKIADTITKIWKTSPKNNSETNEEDLLREGLVPSKLSCKIIDDLRLKKENYWLSKINII